MWKPDEFTRALFRTESTAWMVVMISLISLNAVSGAFSLFAGDYMVGMFQVLVAIGLGGWFYTQMTLNLVMDTNEKLMNLVEEMLHIAEDNWKEEN